MRWPHLLDRVYPSSTSWLPRYSSPPQFGHLFAKGETREAAIRAMVVALKEIKIR